MLCINYSSVYLCVHDQNNLRSSAKEVMVLAAFVCVHVILSVNTIAGKVLNEF